MDTRVHSLHMVRLQWNTCLKHGLYTLGVMTQLASSMGIYVHAWCIQLKQSWIHDNLLLLHTPFKENPLYVLYSLLLVITQSLHLYVLKLHFHTQLYSDEVTIALELNNAHMLQHGCNTVGGFGAHLLTHPNYLVIQCWICATYLYPHTVNQTGWCVYCEVLSCRVGYMPLGAPCDHIIV